MLRYSLFMFTDLKEKMTRSLKGSKKKRNIKMRIFEARGQVKEYSVDLFSF